jgi:hypothetical protein
LSIRALLFPNFFQGQQLQDLDVLILRCDENEQPDLPAGPAQPDIPAGFEKPSRTRRAVFGEKDRDEDLDSFGLKEILTPQRQFYRIAHKQIFSGMDPNYAALSLILGQGVFLDFDKTNLRKLPGQFSLRIPEYPSLDLVRLLQLESVAEFSHKGRTNVVTVQKPFVITGGRMTLTNGTPFPIGGGKNFAINIGSWGWYRLRNVDPFAALDRPGPPQPTPYFSTNRSYPGGPRSSMA